MYTVDLNVQNWFEKKLKFPLFLIFTYFDDIPSRNFTYSANMSVRLDMTYFLMWIVPGEHRIFLQPIYYPSSPLEQDLLCPYALQTFWVISYLLSSKSLEICIGLVSWMSLTEPCYKLYVKCICLHKCIWLNLNWLLSVITDAHMSINKLILQWNVRTVTRF